MKSLSFEKSLTLRARKQSGPQENGQELWIPEQIALRESGLLRQAEQSKKSRIWPYDSPLLIAISTMFIRENIRVPLLSKGLAQVVTPLGTRRTHDARRTFVSLSLADGARRDILRWITHGPEGDVVSLYTTLPWKALCEEVAKLNIGLRVGQVLELRKSANSGGLSRESDEDLLQRLLQTQRVNEKAPPSRELRPSCDNAQGGTRTRCEARRNFKQDKPLPTIALIFLGSLSRPLPSCPVLFL